MNNKTQRISSILKDLGVSPAILGYQYLRYAIELATDDESITHQITKKLYPAIAKKFQSTSSRVERAMRHAIETAMVRADVDVLNSLFAYTISAYKGKPTNSEFIATIADYLLMTEAVVHGT